MSVPRRRTLGGPVRHLSGLGTAGLVSVLGLAGLGTLGGGSAVAAQAAETASKPPGQRVSQPGWRIVDLTAAKTYPGDRLEDVAAVGPRDAWAVGSTGTTDFKPLIRRWDGNSWRTVAAPALPSGAGEGVLRKVVASSSTDVWIFGDTQTGDRAGPSGFGLRWNGANWQTTDFGGGTVRDAVTLARDDVWVVGDSSTRTDSLLPFARHFDGRSWRKAKIPGGPWALSARSARDIWAVGETSGRVTRATVSRWNGRKWLSVPRPRPVLRRHVQYRISDVFARGPRNVWVTLTLSDRARGGAPAGSLLMHWNGRTWKQAKVGLRGDTLFDVTPDGTGGLWLLSFVSPTRTDLLHYAGGRMSRLRAPARPGTTGEPQSLALTPGTSSLWAAGDLVDHNRTVAAVSKYGS